MRPGLRTKGKIVTIRRGTVPCRSCERSDDNPIAKEEEGMGSGF